MKLNIDLDRLIELRNGLGNPKFHGGRDEYRMPLIEGLEPRLRVNATIQLLKSELIFKFNYSTDKWDLFLEG